MKNTKYNIGDIVWVLTTLKGGTYKLPAAGVLMRVDADDHPFVVTVGQETLRFKYVYDRDECFDTALIALRTAENTLRVLGSICEQAENPGITGIIREEEKTIALHVTWLEASRHLG